MTVVLQSLTSAAASMLRLVGDYCRGHGFEKANPLLIHHLLSASIVHLMNMTTKSLTLRRLSTRSVRKCLYLLNQLGRYWTARAQKSVDVIKALAHRWGVGSALFPDSATGMVAGKFKNNAHATIAEDASGQADTPVPLSSLTREQNKELLTPLNMSCPIDSLIDTEGLSFFQESFDLEHDWYNFPIIDAPGFDDDMNLFQTFREFSDLESNQWECI
jgi:hypothetical protein